MFDLQRLIRPNIANLKPYSSARDEYHGKEGVFLDANENPFGTLNRYPDPHQKDLKNAISKIKGIDQKQIFVGNGSDELIDLVFRIFCEPKEDKALTFSPTYGMYGVAANINDVELINIPLNSDFQIDLETAKTYLSDPKLKLILLCSPNNPTANHLNLNDVEYILNNFNGIVMIDEAYIDFSFQVSKINLIDRYPNLIISQTMSKAYGLASARIGLGFAHEDIIILLNKVKPPYNVSLANQLAALEALGESEKYQSNLEEIMSQKEWLKKELSQLDLVKTIYPSDANFFLIKVDDADAIYYRLIDEKIIVRNRHSVLENCIRITVGTEGENLSLINALKSIQL
jgi:histidinol-phosphate aminotransferase